MSTLPLQKRTSKIGTVLSTGGDNSSPTPQHENSSGSSSKRQLGFQVSGVQRQLKRCVAITSGRWIHACGETCVVLAKPQIRVDFLHSLRAFIYWWNATIQFPSAACQLWSVGPRGSSAVAGRLHWRLVTVEIIVCALSDFQTPNSPRGRDA